jgi:hypothetical protein
MIPPSRLTAMTVAPVEEHQWDDTEILKDQNANGEPTLRGIHLTSIK